MGTSGTARVTLNFLGLAMDCDADWVLDGDGIEVVALYWGNDELDLGEVTEHQLERIEFACATDAAGRRAA